jgi:multimeric flavodoxin WrbA
VKDLEMNANDNLMKKVSVGILPEQKILAIGGSPRIHGNSDVLLKHILNGVQEKNVPAEGIQLRDYYFKPCIGCEKCRKDKICTGLNDGMHLLYPKIIKSQGLILLSPTHNYNITAWMKAFIDRLYCFYNFDDKRPRGWSSRLAGQKRKAVIVAVCEQNNKKDMGFTIEAMRLPLEALGYEILEEFPVFGIFDRGAVKKDEEILTKASELGRRFAKSILIST